jgi:hypothetical protein
VKSEIYKIFCEGGIRIIHRFLLLSALTNLLVPATILAQNAAAQPNQSTATPVPTPRRNLNGIWEPVHFLQGIQPNGTYSMPADGKHEPPYTPAGLAAFKRHKSANGPDPVAPGEENDPGHACDPLGFPRADLFEVRATEIIQTPLQMVVLYTYGNLWRSIWSDGRALPKDPDPRWYGYSVGKWVDDYTFVAKTTGLDPRTWVDNAGRPQSDETAVEEVFHRVDRDTLELSLTIEDPKYYTKPWLAVDKLSFRLLPPNFQFFEMMCSPSEVAEYNKRHGNRGAPK